MSTGANSARQRTKRGERATPTIGVDVVEAKKELSSPRRRSTRLIQSVLREAGSADGPVDMSTNLRRYLSEQ